MKLKTACFTYLVSYAVLAGVIGFAVYRRTGPGGGVVRQKDLEVMAADPVNSYLYRKIVGTGHSGDRMPQGGPFLNDSQIALVRNWIRRGAPND